MLNEQIKIVVCKGCSRFFCFSRDEIAGHSMKHSMDEGVEEAVFYVRCPKCGDKHGYELSNDIIVQFDLDEKTVSVSISNKIARSLAIRNKLE